MRMYLAGGERAANRKALLDQGVSRVGFSVSQFSGSLRKPVSLTELFPGVELFVYTSPTDLNVERYDEFLRTHHEHIVGAVGRDDYNGAWLGDKLWPSWSPEEDTERFTFLCKTYGRVMVEDKVVNVPAAWKRLIAVARRYDARLGTFTAKQAVIQEGVWDTLIVSSWTSPRRYGETQVWDGTQFHRFAQAQQRQARQTHFHTIKDLGVDPEAVLADDLDAVTALAIKSWMAYEQALATGRLASPSVPSSPSSEGIVATDPGHEGEELPAVRGAAVATLPLGERHERPRKLLPGLGVVTKVPGSWPDSETDAELESSGDDGVSSAPIVHIVPSNSRVCNSCFLAARCPEFAENSTCAFDVPIQLTDKAALNRMFAGLLEMQGQRIALAQFAEQTEGLLLDEALDRAIDRFFRMAESIKRLGEDSTMVRMTQTVEARGGAGVLSRLFGAEAGAKTTQLSRPVNGDAVLEAFVAEG